MSSTVDAQVQTAGTQMPDQLSPRHIRKRLVQLGGLASIVVVVVLSAPGWARCATS